MDLLTRLLDPACYTYNPYALPLLACAFITFALGIAIVKREHASRVGIFYLLDTLAIGVWFLGFGAAYLSIDAAVAAHWLRFAQVGVAFIPALTLQFTWSVIRPSARLRWLLWLTWGCTAVFAVAALASPAYFGPPYRHFWGYYVHYTAYSTPFVVFVFAVLSVILSLYRWAQRHASPTTVAARRAKLLLIAFAVAVMGAIDFVPGYGVGLYAFGYIPVMISIGLVTYITGRYRLVDVTPEFAAKQIIETMNDSVFVLDKEGVVRVVNETLLAMVGMERNELVDKPVPKFFRKLLTRDEFAAIQRGEPLYNREVEFVRRDGTPVAVSLSVSVMPEGNKQNAAYVGVVRDVTGRKRAEERIRFLAYYDNLTGLPNRELFREQLCAALANAARGKRRLALLFLDLDHFKRINDTLGHTLGDALLQAIAGRLQGCVRTQTDAKEGGGTVARVGGDEFIIALYDLAKQDDAARVAQRILAAVSEPIRLERHEVAITASIGISFYPNDGSDDGALLKNADAAMYQAKEAGRNGYFFFDRSINVALHHRLSLETRLRKALEQGHLSLHYQPQVALRTGQWVGVEGLLRWNDPELGPIPAERFIPIAEESGLILPIGAWALQVACARVRAWHDAGWPLQRIAVNLSSRQFRDRNLVVAVREALEAARLEPRHLELELTESMIMQDALYTRRTLEALKAMGVHLAIDDFGTGYSSLSYLRSFPIETLKIDRSFVHDLTIEPDNGAIIVAILAMAHSLKLGVVGEGVETEEQRRFLQQHGCKFAQGLLFCEPLPADELDRRMEARRGCTAT